VTVRFSHHDSLPSLHIRMGAPAAFDLTITPAHSRVKVDNPVVRTSDEKFNLSYTVRSSQPAHAKIFLSQQRALDAVQQLCGPHVFVSIGNNAIDYSEMGVLETATGNRAYARIESMVSLAAVLRNMPDAERIRIEPIQQVQRASLRLAIALGVMCGLASLAIAIHLWHTAPLLAVAAGNDIPPGISPRDALKMGNLTGWRLALPSDYDPNIFDWAKQRGIMPESHLTADLNGSGTPADSVYVLTNQDGKKRVVVLSHQRDVFDSLYDSIAIVVRVPHDDVASIHWSTVPPDIPAGDGLLLVRTANDVNAGLVFFFTGNRIISGVPANYQYMKLE
jgi:hypothetical protein